MKASTIIVVNAKISIKSKIKIVFSVDILITKCTINATNYAKIQTLLKSFIELIKPISFISGIWKMKNTISVNNAIKY